jgi:D-3-phosphoglycerate dehydrogenase / 2-oxoglutarate reductase
MERAAVEERGAGKDGDAAGAGTPRVLVADKIADSGIELLRRDFDVELGFHLGPDELAERIGGFDALLIRSATTVTAELIERADRLRVIGRAGTGVDNVDIEAATKRGILVVNAPESNSVAAAEHTLAMALAVARNVPQAHGSLVAGNWDRSRFAGNELYGKTLGVIGFGRIGQLVAKRALAFEMEVIAFDKFVAAERFRDLGVEGVETTDELYERSDVVSIHLPKTPETVNWIDAEALAKMRDGALVVNCARGELVDLDALGEALDSGKVGGAALDVFPNEPLTEHPLFERDNVVVTPHLAASTAEAQDRAGVITAEQVRAALTSGVVTNAVNIAAVRPEAMEALAPFVPLCEKLGRLAQGLGDGSISRVEVEFRGALADHDTRLLGIAVLVGILSGHTEEPVNLVNAPAMAEDRGLDLVEIKERTSEDFTELVTVRLGEGDGAVEVSGTGVGPRNIPHLVGVWGERFNMPFADHLAIFRYRDQPGMIGRVGQAFGQHGVNIVSAAVGAEQDSDRAVMALTTDAPVPDEVVQEIAATDGFDSGRAVDV